MVYWYTWGISKSSCPLVNKIRPINRDIIWFWRVQCYAASCIIEGTTLQVCSKTNEGWACEFSNECRKRLFKKIKRNIALYFYLLKSTSTIKRLLIGFGFIHKNNVSRRIYRYWKTEIKFISCYWYIDDFLSSLKICIKAKLLVFSNTFWKENIKRILSSTSLFTAYNMHFNMNNNTVTHRWFN